MATRKNVDESVLKFLENSENPVSTREIASRINISWHTAINHCLRLQIAGKIHSFKAGNMTLWVIKK